MTLKLGTLDVVDVHLGTVVVARVMLGTEQVWPSGPVVVTGTIAALEALDLATIVGTFTAPVAPVVGTADVVESDDIAAIVGTVTAPVAPVVGTVAIVESDDLADILGIFTPIGVIGGVIDVTEVDDLAAIVGTFTPTYAGVIAIVEDDDLAAIVGTVAAPVFTGVIVTSEADDFATVVGTVTAPTFLGTVAVTEDDDLSLIVGTVTAPTVLGTVAVTEDDDLAVITGTVRDLFTGVVAVTELDDTSVITGAVTEPVYTGTVAVTEADDTSAITGTVAVPGNTGVVAVTEEADTVAVVGTFTEPVYTGTIAVTEEADTSTIVGTVPAAFPTIAAVNSEVGTSMGAQAINMPAGIVAGNLLIAIAASDNPSTTVMTASAGWTEIRQQVQGANVMRLAAFGRIADGTATDNLTITGAAQDYVAFTARITNHGLNGISGIFAADATGSTGNGDPPNLATDSDRGWLWLAAEGVDLTTGNTITSVPSGYTSQVNTVSASSTSSVALAVGSRTAAGVSTENPATFTNNPTTRPWVAFTIGIPAAAPTPIAGTVAVTEADDTSVITGSSGAGGGTVYSDDFNRADGPLGAAWTMDAVNPWVVASNIAHRNGADFARYATPMPSADHWVEADITNVAGEFLVLHARAGPTLSSQNLYMGFIDPSGVATIGQLISDGYSTVATGSTGLSTSGKVRFEVEGTTARLYLNGTLVASTTVSGHATGLYVGMNASGNNSPYDNFRAGALPYTP